MALSLGELYVVLDARTSALDRKLTETSNRLTKLDNKVTKVGTTLTTRLTLPLLGLGVAAGRGWFGFNKAFEETNTMMKLSGQETERFKQNVMDLSNTWGKASADIMAAGYKVSSVLHTNADDSRDILEATTMAAKAGKMSVVDSTEAVINSMSMYGIKAKDTMKVVDILAATVREGNASWRDAAMQLPRVAGVAIPLGIGLEDVGGAFAYMSGKANSAAMAAVSTTSLLMSILKPSDRMRKALQDIGKEWGIEGKITGKALIAHKDIGAVIQRLGTYIGDDTDLLTKMIPGIRGIIGATASFRDESAGLVTALRNVKNSAGEAQAQIDAGQGPAERMVDAFTNIRNAGVYAFDPLVPMLLSILEKAGELAVKFQDLDKSTRRWISLTAVIAGAIGPLLMFTGATIRLVSFAMPGLGSFMKLLPVAIKLLAVMTGPVGMVVAAVVALGAALVQVYGTGETFGEKLGNVMEKVKGRFADAQFVVLMFVKNTIAFFQHFNENAKMIWDWLGRNWSNVLSDMAQATALYFVNGVSNMANYITKLVGVFGVFFGWVRDNWVRVGYGLIISLLEVLEKIGTLAQNIGKAIVDGIVTGVMGADFNLTGLVDKLKAQFVKGMGTGGTFAERMKSLNLTEGFVSPLKGFESSMEALPEFNLDWSDDILKTADAAKKLGENTVELGTGAEKTGQAGQKMLEAWKGVGVAVRNSADAYSTIVRTQAQATMGSAGSGPTVSPTSSGVGIAANTDNEKSFRQQMLLELDSIDNGIRALVNMIGTEAEVV